MGESLLESLFDEFRTAARDEIQVGCEAGRAFPGGDVDRSVEDH